MAPLITPATASIVPDCWRDYTSQFRVIITPENLPSVLPALNNYYGGGFSLQDQG